MPAMLVMSSDTPLSKAADCRRLKSPLNFDTYLLSASPPGFEVTAARYLHCSSVLSYPSHNTSSSTTSSKLEGRRKRFFKSTVRDETTGNERMTSPKVGGQEQHKSITETSYYSTVITNGNLGIAGLDLLAVAYSMNNDVTSRPMRHSRTDTDLNRNNESRRKKVSFADDVGLDLELVRVFTESPDTPPEIARDVIVHYEKLAADDGCRLELVAESPLPFDRRAMVIQRVDKNLVSLESLRVTDTAGTRSETGYQLIGRVLVKNVTFEKSVFVRCTFNDWLSSCDAEASFIRSETATWGCPYFGMSSTVAASCLDVFEFRIPVPQDPSPACPVQLAVCFQFSDDGQRKELWDNCDGRNYRVELRPKKIAVQDTPILSSLKHDHVDAAHHHSDLKGPYW